MGGGDGPGGGRGYSLRCAKIFRVFYKLEVKYRQNYTFVMEPRDLNEQFWYCLQTEPFPQ